MIREILNLEQDYKSSISHLEIQSDPLSEWMYDLVRPYAKGALLEVGSRIGNISSLFAKNKYSLTVSDPTSEYCRFLKTRFDGNPFVRGIYKIDLAHKSFLKKYSQFLWKFDTVCMLNPIKPFQDNPTAIFNLKQLIKPTGRVILQLPVKTVLYNDLDEDLLYWKRNNRLYSYALLGKNFEIQKQRIFNLIPSTESDKYEGAGTANPTIGDKDSTYNNFVRSFRMIPETNLGSPGLFLVTIAKQIAKNLSNSSSKT